MWHRRTHLVLTPVRFTYGSMNSSWLIQHNVLECNSKMASTEQCNLSLYNTTKPQNNTMMNKTTGQHKWSSYQVVHVRAAPHQLQYLVAVEKHLELESFQEEVRQLPVIHKLSEVLPCTQRQGWNQDPLQPNAQTLFSQTKHHHWINNKLLTLNKNVFLLN